MSVLLSSILLSLCLWIYSPVKEFDYLAIDDTMHTEANPRLSPLTLENVGSFWREQYENAYTPITYTLWAVLAHLGKNSNSEIEATKTRMNPDGNKFKPGFFHVANLVVHVLTVISVFALLQLLFPNVWAAFAGAVLFAVHPLQVETVCWITGLRDVLAGLFSILSIYLYLRYTQCSESGFQKKLLYSLAFLMFFCGVLCKSSALMAPVISALIVFFIFKRKPLLILIDFIPWGLIMTPILKVFFGLNDSVALKVVHQAPLPQRFLVAGDAVSFYLAKLFFPFELTMDYGRTPQYVLALPERFLTGLLPVAMGLLSLYLYFKKKRPLLLLTLGIFIVGLGPVLGITPFIFQHISTTADRYVYLSMLGPCIAVATLYQSGVIRYIKPLFVTLLVLFAFKSLVQVPIWKNNLTLFSQTLEHNPQSWLASNDLGTYFEGMEKPGTAMSLYERSAEIANIPSAWNNAGAMAIQVKDYKRAYEFFQLAIKSSNGSTWALHNLGAAYMMGGEKKKALEQYELASQRDPRFQGAYKNPIILRKDDGKTTRS